MSINKVMLIGRLGKDPEMRYLDNNVALARFPIATSESYKGTNGEKVEKTEWHNVVVWRKLAEIAGKYLKKGSQIYLEGKLRTRNWDDANGEKRYATEVVVDDFRMLDRKSDGPSAASAGGGNSYGGSQTSQPNKVSEPQTSSSEGSMEDDLPF